MGASIEGKVVWFCGCKKSTHTHTPKSQIHTDLERELLPNELWLGRCGPMAEPSSGGLPPRLNHTPRNQRHRRRRRRRRARESSTHTEEVCCRGAFCKPKLQSASALVARIARLTTEAPSPHYTHHISYIYSWLLFLLRCPPPQDDRQKSTVQCVCACACVLCVYTTLCDYIPASISVFLVNAKTSFSHYCAVI